MRLCQGVAAGGNLAPDLVAQSPADGCTLILPTGGHAVSGAMCRRLRVDPVADFSFVSLVNVFPFVVGTGIAAPEAQKRLADLGAGPRSGAPEEMRDARVRGGRNRPMAPRRR